MSQGKSTDDRPSGACSRVLPEVSVVGACVLTPGTQCKPWPQCACLLPSCCRDGKHESAELGTGGCSRGQEGKCHHGRQSKKFSGKAAASHWPLKSGSAITKPAREGTFPQLEA